MSTLLRKPVRIGIIAFLAAALLFSVVSSVVPSEHHNASAATSQATTCRNLGVYTDWLYNSAHNPNPAPAIWIWNNGVPPTPSKMTIYYNGWWQETVLSPNNWGVRTDAPQLGASNGWLVYYIAGRWYNDPLNNHGAWNDDSRWTVTYCG